MICKYLPIVLSNFSGFYLDEPLSQDSLKKLNSSDEALVFWRSPSEEEETFAEFKTDADVTIENNTRTRTRDHS